MQTELYPLAEGVHANIYAYRTPASIHNNEGTHGEDGSSLERQGKQGWGAVKIVRAGPSGKTRGLKPHNVLREVLCLQKAKHPNIVEVIDYAWSESSWEHQIALPLLAFTLRTLLDYLDTSQRDNIASGELPDLSSLSLTDRNPRDAIFRSVAFQLLKALSHMHALGIAHRDIKPENVMLDWDGAVVLIDFGIAWDETGEDWGGEWKESADDMCCEVGSGPYRAPELLFSPRLYDPFALDIWALGCVLAEFYTADTHQSLFDATYGDVGLAAGIFQILGTPTAINWPSFTSLPDAGKVTFTVSEPRRLLDILPGLSASSDPERTEHFLCSLLTLDPTRRIRAAEVLKDEVLSRDTGLGPEGLAELISIPLSRASRQWDMM